MQNPRHHKIPCISDGFFLYKQFIYIYEQIIHLSLVFEIYQFAFTLYSHLQKKYLLLILFVWINFISIKNNYGHSCTDVQYFEGLFDFGIVCL